MVDISKCQNEDCLKKESCYRYTAEPGEYQSYGDFKPDENGECEYYIKD